MNIYYFYRYIVMINGKKGGYMLYRKSLVISIVNKCEDEDYGDLLKDYWELGLLVNRRKAGLITCFLSFFVSTIQQEHD